VVYEMTVNSTRMAGEGNKYDIFPRGIGNILDMLGESEVEAGFEAHLTRGVWKAKMGSPRTIFPPGAIMMAKMGNSEKEEKWRRLAWSLSGVLGASFEGMGTENLTPWLAVLPCSDRLGLASVLMGAEASKIEFAASEFFSLGLLGSIQTATDGKESLMRMTARLTVQLEPDSALARRLVGMDFQTSISRPCPAIGMENAKITNVPPYPPPPVTVTRSLLRDGGFLADEAYPDRVRAVYFLSLKNRGNETAKISVFDQLPFFLRPLWHSKGVQIGDSGEVEKLNMGLIQLQPTDHWKTASSFHVSVEVAGGSEWQMRVPVLKSHIHTKSYSYACEKGFDMEAAMYEVTIGDDEDDKHTGFTNGLLVMLPMPDFSMPFNVIALSTTVLTIFFSGAYRTLARREIREKSASSNKKIKQSKPLTELSADDLEYEPAKREKLFPSTSEVPDRFILKASAPSPNGKESVGYVEATQENPQVVHFFLSVRKNWENKGIEARLIALALIDAREKWPEVKIAHMYVLADDPSEEIEALGFFPDGSHSRHGGTYKFHYPVANTGSVPKSCGLKLPAFRDASLLSCISMDSPTSYEAQQKLLQSLPAISSDARRDIQKMVVSKVTAFLRYVNKPGDVGGTEKILATVDYIKAQHPELTFVVVSMSGDTAAAPLDRRTFKYIGEDYEFIGNKLYIYKYSPLGKKK
ncbi:hypothetical protein FOL47_002862, partial [Perkinsus chesapeaki]